MSEQLDPLTRRCQARVGQVLRDKWRLDRLLGVGGMASVYAASHRNGMRGAVKVLHVELGLHSDLRERFLREGYVANKVDHPGAVRVLDDDTAEDGAEFLVMELLEGQTVEARLVAQPEGRLDAAEVLAITDELLDVLAAAHDKGIIHRDLKPENLFLTTGGRLKVIDFGIARLREHTSEEATTTSINGGVMGTPAFMPPEQAAGKWRLVDARTDLWAVGATMYALLTGQHVHRAETLQLLMAAAITHPAPPLGALAPHLSPEVRAIVDRALAFDPSHRWASAREMQDAVRAARKVGSAEAHSMVLSAAAAPASAPQRRAPTIALVTGAAAFVAIALLGYRHLQLITPDDPAFPARAATPEAAPSPVASEVVVAPTPTAVVVAEPDQARTADATASAPVLDPPARPRSTGSRKRPPRPATTGFSPPTAER